MWNYTKTFVSALFFALTLPMPAPAQAQSVDWGRTELSN